MTATRLMLAVVLVAAVPAPPAPAQSLRQMMERAARDALRGRPVRPDRRLPDPATSRPTASRPGLPARWDPEAEARDKAEAASAKAAEQPPAALFEPGRLQELQPWLDAREHVARYRELGCRDAMSDTARATNRPGRARTREELAERMETRDRIQADYKGCHAGARAPVLALHEQVRARAASYAAGQPATYEGMVALRTAASSYAHAFPLRGHWNATAEGEGSRDRGQAIMMTRSRAIEEQLRPQIIADLNRTGDTGLLVRLFDQDTQRRFAYMPYFYDPRLVRLLPPRATGVPFFRRRGEAERSTREAGQAAGFAAWTEPTETEMALAVMRAATATGGRQVTPSAVTAASGFTLVGRMLGMGDGGGLSNIMKVYDLRKHRCARRAGGYLCSFTLYSQAHVAGMSDGFTNGLLGMGGSGGSSFAFDQTQLFVPARAGWQVPDLVANAQRTQATQINQAAGVVRDVGDAAGSAMGTMIDARPGVSGDAPEADEKRRQPR